MSLGVACKIVIKNKVGKSIIMSFMQPFIIYKKVLCNFYSMTHQEIHNNDMYSLSHL